MKRIPINSLLFCALLLMTCATEPKEDQQEAEERIEIHQTESGGYHFAMHKALVEAQVDPQDGGKLISLKYQGKELLTPITTDSLTYGSTFWPAPHKWGWPPPASMDRSAYQATLEGTVLSMEGPVIEKLGLQFSKQFTLLAADTALHFRYHILNVSDQPVTVAPWEVTRVPRGGFSFFPTDEEYPAFKDVPSGKMGPFYHCTVPKSYVGKSQKTNFNATRGWLAHVDQEVLLLKQFEDLSAAAILPGEGDVEIYIDDDTDYIELENQGAYQELAPGASLSYETIWYLRDTDLAPKPENMEKWDILISRLMPKN